MGLTRDKALAISGMTRHQYYYHPQGKRPGKPASTTTTRLTSQGKEAVPNNEVTGIIKTIQTNPDTDYGYRTMTYQLKLLAFIINHKKVYRLMQEAGLLKQRHKRHNKQYALYRTVMPERPLQVLEMDIKYMWIQQARRYAFIFTIIDTFTRMVLNWRVGFQMKSHHIKDAWEYVIIHYLQPADLLLRKLHIEVRNDNGPQMIAQLIRNYFEQNHINQVFTHPYTPQENGHIESFHNILGKALKAKAFWSIQDLEQRLKVFYENYNHLRLHGSIAHLCPSMFWQQWEEGNIQRQVKTNKKVKFNLLIPYHQLSGNKNLREASCLKADAFDTHRLLHTEEVTGPGTPQQPSVQQSPSVASC